MVTEMTIEQRFRRQAVFTALMFVLCALAFVARDPVITDLALLTNGVVWAIYNHLTRAALAMRGIDDKEVRIRNTK